MATIDDVFDKVNDVLDRISDLSDQIEDLELISYSICSACNGNKTIIPSHDLAGPTPEPITCPSCNGEGRLRLGSAIEKD